MEEPSIYIVVDIETDGPVLSRHSMRNLSAVVVDQAGKELDTFSENLLPIEGSIPDPGTLIWWQEKNSEVWAKITTDPLEAKEVIRRFEAFIREFEGQRIFVGHPLAFDGLWVSNYMEMFLGQGLMAFHDTQDPLFLEQGSTYHPLSQGFLVSTMLFAVMADIHQRWRPIYPTRITASMTHAVMQTYYDRHCG